MARHFGTQRMTRLLMQEARITPNPKVVILKPRQSPCDKPRGPAHIIPFTGFRYHG